jgi:hypothetical protein
MTGSRSDECILLGVSIAITLDYKQFTHWTTLLGNESLTFAWILHWCLASSILFYSKPFFWLLVIYTHLFGSRWNSWLNESFLGSRLSFRLAKTAPLLQCFGEPCISHLFQQYSNYVLRRYCALDGSLPWISAFNHLNLHCGYQNPSNRSSIVDRVT